MSTRSTPWQAGTPSWADLTTPDATAAAAFYTAVMGWEVHDRGADFGHYAVCTRDGHAAAGLGPAASPDQPTAWTTYLAVDDVEKVAESVVTHGGTLLVPPVTVADQGRMALALDPTGAPFGLWQALSMIGAELVNEPGGMVWNEHHSADPEAARAFYGAVLGHTYTVVEGGEGYTTIDGAGPGNTVGGIGGLAADEAGGPSSWAVYFAVDDADAAVAAATARGGHVVSGPDDTPFGRMATLTDPQGARFSIMGVAATPEAGGS